jgi:hypothetical protein
MTMQGRITMMVFFCGQSRNFIKDEALQDSHFLAREEQH